MSPPTKIAHLFDKYGSICRPVIFWRDRIHGLSIEVSDSLHTVGGPLPVCEGIGAPEMHRLVATIDLEPFEILLPKRKEPGFLSLIFNFDLNSLSTDYVVEGDRLLFAHPGCMFGADPSDPDSELPYDPYPNQFPVQKIGIDVSSEIQFDAFAELCTSQGLHGTFDEPDISSHFFFIMPIYADIDAPFWAAPDNPDGYLVGGNICVFRLNPVTGYVDASNQCT